MESDRQLVPSQQVAPEVVWLFKSPTRNLTLQRRRLQRLHSAAVLPVERLLTLETTKRVLGQASKHQELLSLKNFDGHITPDLPLIDTFSDLIKLKWIRRAPPEDPSFKMDPFHGKFLRIETIAAQARSRRQLTEMIEERGQRSDILLCVSGSSLLRKAPFAKRLLPNCLWILDETKRLQEQSRLPKHLKLWAVANPNIDKTLDYLHSKIHHGAETIITQPPLNADRFDRWWQTIQESQISKSTRIMIGIPMISSLNNFSLWCRLCEIHTDRASITPAPSDDSLEFWEQWNEAFVLKFASICGIGGFHFMPLTDNGRRMTVDLLKRHPGLHTPL